jgi:hypothetical protein
LILPLGAGSLQLLRTPLHHNVMRRYNAYWGLKLQSGPCSAKENQGARQAAKRRICNLIRIEAFVRWLPGPDAWPLARPKRTVTMIMERPCRLNERVAEAVTTYSCDLAL